MRVEKRLRVLEGRFAFDSAVLFFADGSSNEIRGPKNFVLRLLGNLTVGAELSQGQEEYLECIRKCVSSAEAGEGHLIDLVRCFLEGPAVRVGEFAH